MVIVILRGVFGAAFLLAGSYLLVLLALGLGFLAMDHNGGLLWSRAAIFLALFYGLFATALINIGWRMIRTFLSPASQDGSS